MFVIAVFVETIVEEVIYQQNLLFINWLHRKQRVTNELIEVSKVCSRIMLELGGEISSTQYVYDICT